MDQAKKSGFEVVMNDAPSPQLMPYLDSLPLSWIKQAECAVLIEVLHMTMVIDHDKSTAKTFEDICKLMTAEYTKHFDNDF